MFECTRIKRHTHQTRPFDERKELELVRGSTNVFRDFGGKNTDVEQFKALLAAEIINTLDG